MKAIASLTVVSLLLGGSHASGQATRERPGFWVGLGLGAGVGEASCSVCNVRGDYGPVAHASLGGAVSRRTLLGVDGRGWVTKDPQIERDLWMVTALALVYPWPARGLHLQGGLGYYHYAEATDSVELATQGLAVQVGAGFQVRVSAGISLSPFAALTASGFGNPTRLDKPTGQKVPLLSDMTVRFLQFGVTAFLH